MSNTDSYETLMRQSPITVMGYVRDLKEAMGEEWVKANPQAFALLVQAAAIDLHGGTIGKEISKLTSAVVTLTSRI